MIYLWQANHKLYSLPETSREQIRNYLFEMNNSVALLQENHSKHSLNTILHLNILYSCK